jgi:hypothetical protein
LEDDIFEELRQNVRRNVEISAIQCQICDSELQHFLLPLSSQEELEQRQLKLKELQPAFVRHIVAGLGGRKNIQPTKLAEALGCSYNTLMSNLRGSAIIESRNHE